MTQLERRQAQGANYNHECLDLVGFEKMLLKDRKEALKRRNLQEAALLSQILTGLHHFPLHADEKEVRTHEDGIPFHSLVKEEIEGAEAYWNYYQQTGEATFRSMAQQELGHATNLLNMWAADANTEHEFDEIEILRQKVLEFEHSM